MTEEKSKFINNQTLAYLKSKQGNHIEQQLNNVKSRLDIEYNYLDNLIRNLNLEVVSHSEELTNKINYVSQNLQATQKAFDERIKLLGDVVFNEVRRLQRIIIVLAVGAITWLTILSI